MSVPLTIPGLTPYRPLPPRPAQSLQEKTMFDTSILPDTARVPEKTVPEHSDAGSLRPGPVRLTGWAFGRSLRGALSAMALGALALGAAPSPVQAETLLNVSYDPTRELYR
jgi:sulfate transport system substrate-binding protein